MIGEDILILRQRLSSRHRCSILVVNSFSNIYVRPIILRHAFYLLPLSGFCRSADVALKCSVQLTPARQSLLKCPFLTHHIYNCHDRLAIRHFLSSLRWPIPGLSIGRG